MSETPVPPPKADPLDAPDDPTPRDHDQLVVDLMEARDCSKPTAEEWLAAHGAVAGERLVRARWTFPDRDRWSGAE